MTISITPSSSSHADYTQATSGPSENTRRPAPLTVPKNATSMEKNSAIARQLRARNLTTKINIANRDDANGGGRDWDHKTIQELSGRDTVIVASPNQKDLEVNVATEFAASKGIPLRPFQWSHQRNVPFKVGTPEVREDGKSGEGLLLIPGGPVSLPTEVNGTPGMPDAPHLGPQSTLRYPPKTEARGRSSLERLAHQRNLVDDARLNGQPVMAICGGSWHVVSAFGGNTVTSPDYESHHTADMPSIVPIPSADGSPAQMGVAHGTIMQHPISVKQDSLLAQTMRRDGAAQDINVNSVHWSEVLSTHYQDEHAATQVGIAGTDPLSGRPTSELLDVNARISSDEPNRATIEGFESRHGAPILAVQWHPEALAGRPVEHPKGLPSTSGFVDADYETERNRAVAQINAMAQTGDAYAARREMTREFKEKVATGQIPKAPVTSE